MSKSNATNKKPFTISDWCDNKPDFNRCVRHVKMQPNSFNKKTSSLGDPKFTKDLLVTIFTRLAAISTTWKRNLTRTCKMNKGNEKPWKQVRNHTQQKQKKLKTTTKQKRNLNPPAFSPLNEANSFCRLLIFSFSWSISLHLALTFDVLLCLSSVP